MAGIYSPGDEKIGFAEVMELKLDMETDRHSRNLGDGSRRDDRFRLIASHNYKNIMGLIRKVYINWQSTHQDFFGLKGVRIPTRPKVIMDQVTSAR